MQVICLINWKPKVKNLHDHLPITARRYNYVGVGERAKAGEQDLSVVPG